MRKKITAAVLVFLALCAVLPSQGRSIHFKRISIDEGLSQNSIFGIIQDSKGFMWFGTQDGLNKYDGYKFTIYKPVPGNPDTLSHNLILALCEDRSGMIWIGTAGGGLNRFDPKQEKFFRYPVAAASPNHINSTFIIDICLDHNGNLWIATGGGGLSKLTLETKDAERKAGIIREKITTYRHNPNNPDSLGDDGISSVVEDNTGTIWIGTGTSGVDRFNRENETFTHYRHNENDPASLSHNNVIQVLADSSGMIWVGTVQGLNLLDKETGTFTRYLNRPGNPNSLSSDNVSDILEDRSGVLWVSTFDRGLNRFDKRSETFTHYRSIPGDPNSLGYDNIATLYEDRSRILWIGTQGKGLNKFDRSDKFAHYRQNPNNLNSLNDSFIYSLWENHTGILWIGTSDGGLNKFDRNNNTFKYYRNIPGDPNSISHDRVRCLLEDKRGVLWAGTDGGGLNKFNRLDETFSHYRNIQDNPNSLSSDFIYTLYEDSSGVLWIGTNGRGLNKMNRETGTFYRYVNQPDNPNSLGGNQVYIIFEAPSEPGTLWIGTRFNGVDRFDSQREKFTHYTADPADSHSLSSNQVTCIQEDSSGVLWVGTYGGGLNKAVRNKNKKEIDEFYHYTEKDGLCNNSVYGILEDPEGNLWLSTNKGLSRFDPRKEIFKNFTFKDGLQGSEFNGGAYHKSRTGEMFFGGINGFNAFFPANVRDNPYIPAIALTGFRFHNEEVAIGPDSPLKQAVAWTKELRLKHRQNDLSFEFAALDFTIPEKNEYAYKMEGYNKNWITTHADQRVAYFTNLAPGEYVFRVKGSNNDGVWNEEGAALKIIIKPPYWASWWFRIAMLLVIAGIIVLLYKRRLKNVRIKAELRTAHNAQMSIMPQQDPQVENFDVSGVCIPANEVGGDFFDYIWLNVPGSEDKVKKTGKKYGAVWQRTKFCIAIGDVSGKAMMSAMTAVMTSGMIYLKADESSSIKEIMQRINRPLYFKTGKNVFTALCLALFDIETREMTFANAGLNAPLLKSRGKVIKLAGAGNKLPLGVKVDCEYREKKQQLLTGDVVLLFTDGITEARNHAKEFYGHARLKELLENMDVSGLSAKEIKEKIIAAVKHFSQGAAPHDDIAIVVVKVL